MSGERRSPDVRVEIAETSLSADEAIAWATRADCGGVVAFLGTVRDNSEGRDHVTSLEYEAYLPYALERMREIAEAAERRFGPLGAVALLHRSGRLEVGETAVVVVVSAPHRAAAFDAAAYCIDTLKEAVPIWKRETWAEGDDWGLGANQLRGPTESVAGATREP